MDSPIMKTHIVITFRRAKKPERKQQNFRPFLEQPF